jgi:succinate dehydrogenase/fumarate reductase cytochrome b subunit
MSEKKRFQNYRGTWAWLIQRISAIGLFLLIPMKIYTGWAARGKVPNLPEVIGSAKKIHFNSAIGSGLDIALLLFFLLHGLYGLRVILIDVGVIREDRWFWRMLALSLGIFSYAVWFVYIHEY